MCGIFGCVSNKGNVTSLIIEGLKRLEYRGYDSAGIAGLNGGALVKKKEVGKVALLEERTCNLTMEMAIGHTRWATHGEPNIENAHPHFDKQLNLALVHNGIIENFQSLKKQLIAKGDTFTSDTDTEVVAHLIAHFYQGDIVNAVQETLSLLKGAFAIALIHKDHPGKIIAVAHESPMVIGLGQNEAFVSSDSHAFVPHTREVVFLSNSEIAVVEADKLAVYNSALEPVTKEAQQLSHDAAEATKGDYEHFTLKEIFEQPQALRNVMASRFIEEYGTAFFERLTDHANDLHSVERILILGCGTSWNAGSIAAYMLEDLARIPVQVEISSEFRYKNPIVRQNTVVMAISQSGETADTIAAVRELKAKGAKVFAICNVQGSTLVREADYTMFLHAGPEIGVCSTKAFTSQLTLLFLFTLLLARMRPLSRDDGARYLDALKALPGQVQYILDNADQIAALAKKYAAFENVFFIGRSMMFPASLEGALKLKEISYVNANGYPAGEMKHGPIALINEQCLTVALCANKATYQKMISNLMEIKARKGPILAIVEEEELGVEAIADATITIPSTIDELAPITTTVVTQLLAYYIAKERGAEIDQPRNLAKSVTVE